MQCSSDSYTTTYIGLLKEVAVAANEAMDVDGALYMVLRIICRFTGWPVGHALKRRENSLYSSGIWHVDEGCLASDLSAFHQTSEQQCFASGIGLPGRVLAEGRPICISDTSGQVNLPDRAAALQAGFTAGFAFPVRSGDSTIAVLEFFTPVSYPLSPELLDVMAQVCVQLGQVFERQAAQKALQASEQRSRQILDSAGDAFIAMDARGVITAWNKAAETIFGWPLAEVVGQTVTETIVPLHYREAHQRGMERFVAHGNAQSLGRRLELPALNREGREFSIEITLWSLKEEHEWSFFAFARDITARKVAEQDLEHRALHDFLTGLPNRSLLLDRLRQCLSQRNEASSGLALLFIDLDDFKRVNDSFGHEAGDQVLITVAQRLQRAMSPGDTVARLAGDEFVMVCPGVATYCDAAAIAERLLSELAPAIHLKDGNVFVAASLGIAMAESGCNAEKLISSADIAMYEAKTRDRGSFQLFDEKSRMPIQTATRLRIEHDLRRALACGEFRLFFQPVINTASGVVVSVEALLRWQHPEQGLLLPADFISIAEQTGLIVPIGIWVIEEACRLAQTWSYLCDASAPLGVSVHLCGVQLIQPDLIETVKRIFSLTAFDSTRIEFGFKVTEVAVMRDPETAAARLQALRDLGARISIDDFGTGYSSLAYLKRFPVDTLKMDRSFLTNIFNDRIAQTIVRAVTEMAHGMGLKVIADGVETVEQAQILQGLDVDFLQGILYACAQPEG